MSLRCDDETTVDQMPPSEDAPAVPSAIGSSIVRSWFGSTFPQGPTPAQALAWPSIKSREHVLLISPTGTGKTLAAFLSILDQLYQRLEAGTLNEGLCAVYVSPLRSLGYDIERNLNQPIEAIRAALGTSESPVSVGVRTGDTSSYQRQKLRKSPPHLLITTPESLSLLLSQRSWEPIWKSVEYLIIDEVHALVPTKRGVDLSISMERLAALAERDPVRIGLSATLRPPDPAVQFLVGPGRACRVLEAPRPSGESRPTVEVESLLKPNEIPSRGIIDRRLIDRIVDEVERNRTTIVFANTRAFTERITHELKEKLGDDAVAAHHSALDADRRRAVEASLKAGELRVVVTSTSLELGVDIGTADLAVLVGLPGSVARCLQRVGRAGHRLGTTTRGLLLASNAAELAGAAVTASAARSGDVEPLRLIEAPLDVLCQQLIGMAAAGECSSEEVFELIRKAGPMKNLRRSDFDDCLRFLAGELASPPGAWEPEPGATPRWTSPRIWKKDGLFGIRNNRVTRWFRANVGLINSEESVHVVVGNDVIGTLEGNYAERLQPGDRFLLDGRSLEFRRLRGLVLHAKLSDREADLPRWSSDRQSLSRELALELARFRDQAGQLLIEDPTSLRGWLIDRFEIEPDDAALLERLIDAQQRISIVPNHRLLLVEESPELEQNVYSFHAPLSRAASEAAGRAIAARLGERLGTDLGLTVADLGWQIRVPLDAELSLDVDDIRRLIQVDGLEQAVLIGVDHGDLSARRFRHIAANALMILRRPEGGRTKVGGLLWVSQRLFPLVKAATPDHPLLRETNREVVQDLLDAPSALDWFRTNPEIRLQRLDRLSPFARAWIDGSGPEPLRFEPPEAALRRLHARLTTPEATG